MPKTSKVSPTYFEIIGSATSSEKISTVVILLLFILAGYICFYRLGAAKFADWDEAWYAEMTRAMLDTKQFVVLQWNHGYLFDKPPLYIWSSALFSSLFGLSEYSVRLTSAIAGFFTIILAVWYSYRNWGILSGILTFSTLALNNIFIWRVRSGNLDALAAFLIFLSFLAMVSKWKHRYLSLGVLFGLIFLAKASLVLFPLVIFVLYELIYPTKNSRTTILQYVWLVLLSAVVVVPWLLLGGWIAGWEFIRYYLFDSDQGVAGIRWEYFNTDYFWHAYYSLQRRFFFVFAFGLVALLGSLRKGTHFLLVSFSLFLLVVLSFTERDNNWYLVPSLPFWAITVGFGTYTFIRLFTQKIFQIPAALLVVLLTIYVSQKTFRENITPMLHASAHSYQVESAQFANTRSGPNETIVRLDHLYPSAIYYSHRKVLSSPKDVGGTSAKFIGRKELSELIKSNQIKIVIGNKSDVTDFISTYNLHGTIHEINMEEAVFEAEINMIDL